LTGHRTPIHAPFRYFLIRPFLPPPISRRCSVLPLPKDWVHNWCPPSGPLFPKYPGSCPRLNPLPPFYLGTFLFLNSGLVAGIIWLFHLPLLLFFRSRSRRTSAMRSAEFPLFFLYYGFVPIFAEIHDFLFTLFPVFPSLTQAFFPIKPRLTSFPFFFSSPPPSTLSTCPRPGPPHRDSVPPPCASLPPRHPPLSPLPREDFNLLAADLPLLPKSDTLSLFSLFSPTPGNFLVAIDHNSPAECFNETAPFPRAFLHTLSKLATRSRFFFTSQHWPPASPAISFPLLLFRSTLSVPDI